jgi:hypothetical protein
VLKGNIDSQKFRGVMIVGIVGSEGAKFTSYGEGMARGIIVDIFNRNGVTGVASGGCHLGGIDVWAIELAKAHLLETYEFLPKHLSWEYFKKRNLEIVDKSDEVHCITVDILPSSFQGMKFDFCYHCGTKDHVKSGGCWTMRQAIKQGKLGQLHIVRNLE